MFLMMEILNVGFRNVVGRPSTTSLTSVSNILYSSTKIKWYYIAEKVGEAGAENKWGGMGILKCAGFKVSAVNEMRTTSF